MHPLVVAQDVVVDDAGERGREADRVDRVERARLLVGAEVDAREAIALDDELADRLEDLRHHPLHDVRAGRAAVQVEEVLVVARVARQGAVADAGDRDDERDRRAGRA